MATERDDERIYGELVDLMYSSFHSIFTIGMAVAVVALTLWLDQGAPVAGLIGLVGVVIALARCGLTLAYRRAHQPMTSAAVRRWERGYALGGLAFSLSISILAAWTYLGENRVAQLLASFVVLAYPTGMIVRVAVRPKIARAQLLCCLVPAMLAALIGFDLVSLVVAVLLAAYVMAGFEMIRYLHSTTTGRLMARHQLEHLAHHDPLTQLPNRRYLDERLERCLDAAPHERIAFAVHAIDLDGFKTVNDAAGHAAGDGLLKTAADSIRYVLGEHDFAARMGGDEFVVVQMAPEEESDVLDMAGRLVSVLDRSVQADGRNFAMSASIGVALAQTGTETLNALMRRVDAALYRAKAQGRGRYVRAGIEHDGEDAAGPKFPCAGAMAL